MKFARYLQDTQVPEWKKAYIDYRCLKKHVSAVKKQQENQDRKYRSSLYLGTPVRPHVLRFPTSGNDKEDPFRCDSSASLPLPRLTKQPYADVEKSPEIFNPNLFDASPSISSQSKTLCIPMHERLPSKFSEAEIEFLRKLDRELEKVDTFYLEREKEVKEMLIQLKRQLQELKGHQKCSQSKNEEGRLRFPLKFLTSRSHADSPPISTPDGRFGPMESRRAKKKLKKAVIEHYKKLDALQNFRTLNLIGFQKALKKWEKVTHMAIREAYLKDKIEPSGFSSTKLLAELIGDTEQMYTMHFASGDKKKALYHLRAGWKQKTHYFVTFRSGVYLGLAMPALISGLYQSFQQQTRHQIPAWDGLLLVYATIFVPVLFSLLVAINILVWTKVRINHVFIFGLDVKSKIDYQQYIEIPAIALSTLCYSFWLSFNQIGSHAVAPKTWPLIWLGFNTFILCNPLPVQHRSSRVWLIKLFARLLVSGFTRVEFSDFWMGDQICSLNFSLTNLYLIGCVYRSGFGPNWNQQCGAQSQHRGHLAARIILSMLPFFCRFVQSLRRWYDSRSKTHLINAGKYTTGMFMYALYYTWRYKGNKGSFVVYILAAVTYNLYACIWDYLTDWSLLRPRAKYPLLRNEVLCADHVSLYYFAIISNFLIRFSWIMYLPSRGLPFDVRSFILAMLEMLRRWQWNFLRLENEHLGNIDQYRATRDVPLPYAFDSMQDSDAEDCNQSCGSPKGWAGRFLTSRHREMDVCQTDK